MTTPPTAPRPEQKRLTAEQRLDLAMRLRDRAKNQKSLTPEQRKEALRCASNLLIINLAHSQNPTGQLS